MEALRYENGMVICGRLVLCKDMQEEQAERYMALLKMADGIKTQALQGGAFVAVPRTEFDSLIRMSAKYIKMTA